MEDPAIDVHRGCVLLQDVTPLSIYSNSLGKLKPTGVSLGHADVASMSYASACRDQSGKAKGHVHRTGGHGRCCTGVQTHTGNVQFCSALQGRLRCLYCHPTAQLSFTPAISQTVIFHCGEMLCTCRAATYITLTSRVLVPGSCNYPQTLNSPMPPIRPCVGSTLNGLRLKGRCA